MVPSSDRVDSLVDVDTSQDLTDTVGSIPKGTLLEVGSMADKPTEVAAQRRTLRLRGGLQTSSQLSANHRCLPGHCC